MTPDRKAKIGTPSGQTRDPSRTRRMTSCSTSVQPIPPGSPRLHNCARAFSRTRSVSDKASIAAPASATVRPAFEPTPGVPIDRSMTPIMRPSRSVADSLGKNFPPCPRDRSEIRILSMLRGENRGSDRKCTPLVCRRPTLQDDNPAHPHIVEAFGAVPREAFVGPGPWWIIPYPYREPFITPDDDPRWL